MLQQTIAEVMKISLHYDSLFQNVRIKWICYIFQASYSLEDSARFTFLMLMDSLFLVLFSYFFSPGQIQIIDVKVAERDWPVPVTREAWPWNLPRRPATVQYAMTMPQATITEFGLARAVRPSSREVFKVIVCCKQLIPFFNPKRGSNRGRHMISHLYKTLLPRESTSIYDRNTEKRQGPRKRSWQMSG